MSTSQTERSGRRGSVSRALAGGAALSAVAAGAAVAAAPVDFIVDPFELSPEQLFDATVISTTRGEQSVWDASAAIYVLTDVDIARSGATSIPELLRLVPGVHVARIHNSGWAIAMRGFNGALTNKLLVLIDGREVYDPLFSGVYWDVQDTALADIERIEVVRGPGASLWGANAVNGVINIVTKPTADTQGGLVTATAGNIEQGVLTARWGGALGDDAHWRVYAKHYERAGQESQLGGSANDAARGTRGGFRFDAAPSAIDSFTVQGEAYRSDTGQRRIAALRTPPYSTEIFEDIDAEGGHLMGSWTHEVEGGGRLTTRGIVELTRRDQFTLEDERLTFDAEIQHEFATRGAHAVVAGARYRNTNVEFTPTPLVFTTQASRRDELVSAFLQDEIGLAPRWRLTLGSKLEHNDYTGVEFQPNARLQWSGENQTAWTSVSRAVRTPTAIEHEFTSVLLVLPPGPPPLLAVPIEIDLEPNPAFESEELIAYEAGYRRRWTDAIELDLAAFFNDYDKLATSSRQTPVLATNPLRVTQAVLLSNMTTAEAYGVEAVLNWRATDDLELTGGYSVLEIAMHGPPQAEAFDAEAGEGRAPQNQAVLRAQWDATDRLALDGTLLYVDELPDFGVDAYVRADARVGLMLTEELQLELIGQNLFDESHREFGEPTAVGVALIERSVFARLTWRP